MSTITLTKLPNGNYRSDDGRWTVEKIDGAYRLWRVHRSAAVSLVDEFGRLAEVRDYLAAQEAGT